MRDHALLWSYPDRRLEQKIGRGRKHAPALAFFDDVLVILLRLKPQQRQLEAALPTRLGMATARVAARLR